MIFLFYLLLGLVQGLTEFLPVSSSGHLVLLNKIFGIEQNFLFLSVLLHVATLLAVIIVLRKQIWHMIKNPFSKQTLLLIVATIPTVVIVLLFKGFFENAFSGKMLPVCFAITATLLIFTSLFSKQKNKKMSYRSAIIMGISQGIAVLPGISRSGATICSGLICGEDKKQITEFSFLMSIPIIICSLIYETYQTMSTGGQLFSGNILLVFLAFIIAFVSGVFAIKFMLKIVEKGKYYYFSIYLYMLAIACLFI